MLPGTVKVNQQSHERQASLVIVMDAPRHLSQSYIVYRVSPYQLRISRYAKWESPPDEIVRRAIRDTLAGTGRFRDVRAASLVSEGSYVLEINLKRFERTESENDVFGELSFDMKLVSPEEAELSYAAITKKVKLEDGNFLSLARGLSAALGEALEEVQAEVSKP